MDSLGVELKLHEIFPTLDRETVHAVYEHNAGDTYAAMLQLIELLGEDEEALEVTFALLQAEDLDDTSAQLAHDEQVALALQQELAISEHPSAGDHSQQASAASEGSGARGAAVRKMTKLSSDARQLLIKFGRQRARTSTQRLLEPTSIDSAAIEVAEEPAAASPPERLVPPSALDEESMATGHRTGPATGEDGREAQYHARLMRARASRRPSTGEETQSIMTNA